ncbi:hypothetical protein MHYMCMPSP_00117, partial [Hyalomma marginatum]
VEILGLARYSIYHIPDESFYDLSIKLDLIQLFDLILLNSANACTTIPLASPVLAGTTTILVVLANSLKSINVLFSDL